MREKIRRRAWLTYAGCMILTIMCYGTALVLSIYIKGLCEAFNATTTQIQLLYTIKAACSVVVSFTVAGLMGRIAPRRLLSAGVLFYFFFFLCLSSSHSLIIYYVGAVCFGIGVILMGSAVVQPVVTKWHPDHLGVKLGALTVSYAVIGALFSILFTKLQLSIGTQRTLLIHGLILLIPSILSVLFLISDDPEKYGLTVEKKSLESAEKEAPPAQLGNAFSTRECFRRPETWLLLLGILLDSILYGGYHCNASLVYNSIGFDAMRTASLISIQTIFVSIWGFGYGFISDRMGSCRGTIVVAAFVCLTMVIALLCSSGYASFPLAAVLAAMVGSVCYQSMAGSLVFAELFGAKAVGVMMGVCMGFVYIGQMIGTPIATLLYEHTGSYRTFFLIMTVVTALVTVMYVVMTQIHKKRTTREKCVC